MSINVGSRIHAVVTIQQVDEFGSPLADPISLESRTGLSEFVYEEALGIPSQCTMDIQTADWDQYEGVFIGGKYLDVSFSVQVADEPPLGLEKPIRVVVVGVTQEYSGNVLLMGVEATDLGLRMRMSNRFRIWKDETISAIVTTIAEEHGLDVDVDLTDATEEGLFVQGGCSDFDFIKYCLLPWARSRSTGGSDYFFHIGQGRELFFKTPDFNTVVGVYDYVKNDQYNPTTQQYASHVERFQGGVFTTQDSDYRYGSVILAGGDQVRFVGVNPFTKECFTYTANEDVSNSRGHDWLWSRPPEFKSVTGARYVHPIHMGFIGVPVSWDVQTRSNARWNRNAHRVVRVNPVVGADPTVKAGDVIRVNITKPAGFSLSGPHEGIEWGYDDHSALTGLFLVERVVHTVAGPNMTTEMYGTTRVLNKTELAG